METEILPACIAQSLAELDASRIAVLALVEPVRLSEEVAALFDKYGYDSCSYVSLPGNRVVHYYHMRESLEEVLPILAAYRERGIKSLSYADAPEHRNRSYQLSNGSLLYVVIPASYDESGAVCKFVQTGTRQVPVYALKCEGAE